MLRKHMHMSDNVRKCTLRISKPVGYKIMTRWKRLQNWEGIEIQTYLLQENCFTVDNVSQVHIAYDTENL